MGSSSGNAAVTGAAGSELSLGRNIRSGLRWLAFLQPRLLANADIWKSTLQAKGWVGIREAGREDRDD